MEIPDKRYFKIGEVSELTGVEAHVLRYWEGEFSVIRPQRAGSKQRLFRRQDVENILRIKQLLYEEGFTIAGAKKALAKSKRTTTPSGKAKRAAGRQTGSCDRTLLKGIKTELVALKKLLEKE